MPFKKGQSGNLAGKPKGTLNELTRTVKERVLEAFNKLQDDPKANLLTWGRENPGLFYPIAARLIPAELLIKQHRTIEIIVPEITTSDGKVIELDQTG